MWYADMFRNEIRNRKITKWYDYLKSCTVTEVVTLKVCLTSSLCAGVSHDQLSLRTFGRCASFTTRQTHCCSLAFHCSNQGTLCLRGGGTVKSIEKPWWRKQAQMQMLWLICFAAMLQHSWFVYVAVLDVIRSYSWYHVQLGILQRATKCH